uniref:Coiled-coil domain-containing protein 86 n=1 Tax=Theropithecus gelada TaxID=9565 RepID=A0A8D2K3N5_THEGE
VDHEVRRSRPSWLTRLTSVSWARLALVEFESNPEETRKPGSPPRVQQAGLGSPQRQPETSPESPSLQQGAKVWGHPKGSQNQAQGPPTESSPEPPQCQPKPSEEAPQCSQDQGELASEWAQSPEELPRGCGWHQQLYPGPGSPGPYPSRYVPSSEPPRPVQELTPKAPGSLPGSARAKQAASGWGEVTGGHGAEKGKDASAQAPVSKKLEEEEEEFPVIQKGRPKLGWVWKDHSKKKLSQMVQDRPLHTSWQWKMKEQQERKLAKDAAPNLEEEKEKHCQEKKQRRAEIVQVTQNPTKLKLAKTQQLRSTEKRDTLTLLQKQPSQQPAYKV